MRRLGLVLLALALLASWMPLGAAQLIEPRGAAVAPDSVTIPQGGNATFTITLWNNGTSADRAHVHVNSGLNATPAPDGSANVTALSQGSLYVTLAASVDQPTGDYAVDLTVTWDGAPASNRTLHAVAHVEPHHDPAPVQHDSVASPARIDVAQGSEASFAVVSWNNDSATDAASYHATVSTPGGNGTGSLHVHPPARQTVSPGNSTYARYDVTVDHDASPGDWTVDAIVRWDSGSVAHVPVTVHVSANTTYHNETVNVTVTPSRVTIGNNETGDSTTLNVTLREMTGHSVVVHLDVNSTDAPGSGAIGIRYDNMIWSLGPYDAVTVPVTVTATSSTRTGEHRVVSTASDDQTGAFLGESFAVVDVAGGLAPHEDVHVAIAPSHQNVTPGYVARYTVTLAERAGLTTSLSLYANSTHSELATSPHATLDEVRLTLAPYETRDVGLTMTTENGTLPGDYDLYVPAWSQATGATLGRGNASLTVTPGLHKDPPPDDATVHLHASLAASVLNVTVNGSADILVHVSHDGNVTLLVDAMTNASGGLLLPNAPRDRAAVEPGAVAWLRLTLRPPADAAPGTYFLPVVVTAPDAVDVEPVSLVAEVHVLPADGLTARADAASSAPNATAVVHVHVTNHGTRAATVLLLAEPGVTLADASLTIEPGADAALDASVFVPADASIGATLHRTLTLRSSDGDLTVSLAVTVLPPASPPVAPAPPDDSPLHVAGELIAAHPGAAASLAVATASGGALLLARRQGLRYVALASLLPLYTRLAKPAMLSDERRGEIHALIAAQPGIHMDALRQAMGISTSALVHHVRMLERHGFLTSRRDGKLRRFYVSGAAPTALAAGPTAMQEQVLGLLAAGPLTRPEIGARLGLSQQGVSYHVKNLERSGRVVVRRAGGEARVHRVYDTVVTVRDDAPRDPRARP